MELKSAESLTLDLMQKHGLLSSGWNFQWSKTQRCLGLCYEYYKLIRLSLKHTQIRDQIYVRNTIIHEIAHALVGCKHNHDKVWQKKCIELGGSGERSTKSYQKDGLPTLTQIVNSEKKPEVGCTIIKKATNSKYQIVEFNPRRYKFPVIVRESISGKWFKISLKHYIENFEKVNSIKKQETIQLAFNAAWA